VRARTRTLMATAVVGGALTISSPALAGGHNCSDYDTSAEATAAMGPGDPEGLDADNDGIACETLPAGSTSGTGDDSDDEQSSDAPPTGGVDAGMGGAADDDAFAPAGLAVLGGGLAIGGVVVMRRRLARQ
jgi:hypothetical protein